MHLGVLKETIQNHKDFYVCITLSQLRKSVGGRKVGLHRHCFHISFYQTNIYFLLSIWFAYLTFISTISFTSEIVKACVSVQKCDIELKMIGGRRETSIRKDIPKQASQAVLSYWMGFQSYISSVMTIIFRQYLPHVWSSFGMVSSHILHMTSHIPTASLKNEWRNFSIYFLLLNTQQNFHNASYFSKIKHLETKITVLNCLSTYHTVTIIIQECNPLDIISYIMCWTGALMVV